MAKFNEIRIPCTTALFINGLARILRECFNLSITKHECWTFVKVAEWEQCNARGKCSLHGVSNELLEKLESLERINQCLDYITCCDPYIMSAYLGTGQVEIDWEKVALRVRIEETEHSVFGCLFEVRIWMRYKNGEMFRGIYNLSDNGYPHVITKPFEMHPPKRIAF